MERHEIEEALETIIRCSIHKVSVPDSDITILVDTLYVWIEDNFVKNLTERDKEIERKNKEIDLRKRIIDHIPLCPDHRDKFQVCPACLLEHKNKE